MTHHPNKTAAATVPKGNGGGGGGNGTPRGEAPSKNAKLKINYAAHTQTALFTAKRSKMETVETHSPNIKSELLSVQ